ncbi:MAG: STAS/SEC14 domain-containing protein [Bacteroidota bacterium]
MATRIYPIWHCGKKIFFTDWSNLLEVDEALKAIEQTTSFVEKNNEYNLLELLDVRGSYSSPKVFLALKDAGKRTKPYSQKKAIVGITGSKRILLKAVNRFINGNIKGFEDIEEAKSWLSSDN